MAARLMEAHGEVQRSKEGVVHLIANRIVDRTDLLDRLSEEGPVPIKVSRADVFVHPQVSARRASRATCASSPSRATFIERRPRPERADSPQVLPSTYVEELTMTQPIRFEPAVEKIEPDEQETIEGLEEQFRTILETTSKDYDHAVPRGCMPRATAIARGTLDDRVRTVARTGAGPVRDTGQSRSDPAAVRPMPADILDDSIDLPRGLALKILGVEGERLPGSEDADTQDFVMVNGPAFAAADPKAFLKNLKLLAKTTDKGEGAKKLLSGLFRAAESAIEVVGGQSAFLTTLGGAKPVHPLGATYYTQTPYRYGDYVAKLSLAPVSSWLKRWRTRPSMRTAAPTRSARWCAKA